MKNFILLLFVILGSNAYAEKVVLNSYNPEPCESGKKNELRVDLKIPDYSIIWPNGILHMAKVNYAT